MKKINFIIIFVGFLSFTVSAQHFYINGSGAYSMQMPSAYNNVRKTAASGTSTSFESVKINLSSGIHPQITLGYYLNKYASFEISGGYHFGVVQIIDNEVYEMLKTYTQTTEQSIQYGFLNPCFVINPGFVKWNPYLGMGVFVGYSNQMTEEITNSNSQYLRRYTSSGGNQFGFFGKLGMNYSLNSKWKIFSELSFTNATWSPNKKHLNAAIDASGNDIYDGLKPHDVLINYSEDAKHGNPGLPDMSKPQKKQKISLPMDFVSLGLGVRFEF